MVPTGMAVVRGGPGWPDGILSGVDPLWSVLWTDSRGKIGD